jgi:hypothetical protein
MAFASTDLIAVDRGGTTYQETFGNRSNIDTTDELMVEATTTDGGRVIGEKYRCDRYDWDGGGTGGTSGGGGTPVAADLLLVERPVCTTTAARSIGTTALYVSSLPATLVAGTRILFEGASGYPQGAEFVLTSTANATDTNLVSTYGLKGDGVSSGVPGGVLYKATKADWDGAAGQDIYTANYSPTIVVNTTGTSGDSADAYNVLSFDIDVGGTSQTGDLYFGQKNNATTMYYGDICVSAIQIFQSDGTTLRYAWSFHHGATSTMDWDTSTNQYSTETTDPWDGGVSWGYVSFPGQCATANKWCICNPSYGSSCVTSQYTGAQNGISSLYGTYNGSVGSSTALPSSGTVTQTSGAYYTYNETSNPAATGNIVWMRTATNITVSSGDIIRIAYLAVTRNNGTGTTADNTFWFRWD